MKVAARAKLRAGEWDAFVEWHTLGWFWHAEAWLDYSLSYTEGATDLSFAVIDRDHIVAVVPLIANEGQLVCGGQTTPAPLIVTDDRVARFAQRHAEDVFGRVALPVQTRPGCLPYGPPPPGLAARVEQTHIVDMRDKSEATLWRGIRKSYKNLIHRAEKQWTIEVHAKPWAVEAARELHRTAAGRVTRPIDTWDAMKRWTLQGNGMVALAKHPTRKEYAGFAYAIRYKHWGYYASGATLVPNLAHALQWHLIKTLRGWGDVAYEVGHDASDDASEKEQGIAHFKAGFGSVEVPVVTLTTTTLLAASEQGESQ